MKFTCIYCGKKIDIRKADKYDRKICDKPLLHEVVACCKHCHRFQRVTVMDTLQKMNADKYGKILQQMNASGLMLKHPGIYSKLLKDKLELEDQIRHRHTVLMGNLERLQQEGVLIDGK